MKLLCIPDTRASWSVKRQGIWAGPYFFLSGLLVWKTIIFCTGSYKCFHHFIFVKFECVRGLFFQNFSLGVIPLHTTCYLCFFFSNVINNSEGSNTYFGSIEKITRAVALDIVQIFLGRGFIDFEGSHDIHFESSLTF